MKIIINSLLAFLFIGLFTNKVFAGKIPLSKMRLELSEIEFNGLGIIIWDQRPMITDQSKEESFLGYLKSAVGISYPQYTKSDESISKIMLKKIQEAYNRKDIKINILESSPFDKRSDILKKVKNYERDKILLITINNLQFDGTFKVDYVVNIDLQILDNIGNLIFEKKYVEKISIGSAIKKAIPETIKNIFEILLNDSKVIESINGTVADEEDQKTDEIYDIIITKSGDEIKSQITEIDLEVIKYKSSKNLNGPIRVISKAEVFMIKYKNGDKEVFKE